MTHDEVTAAMKAEDVPAEWVEIALVTHVVPGYTIAPVEAGTALNYIRDDLRAALAAVAPEIQAQALREAADLRHGTDLTPTTMSLGTDQGWWYEYLQRLDETWRANLRARAARLTATTEEPT